MAGEGSKVGQSLRVKYFDSIPPPEQFVSEIERSNVPAVLRGAVKEWGAITKWDPRNGGLDYLQERVGSNTVEAMLSKSTPVFYGDLRSHERVPISFSEFTQSCKSCQNSKGETKFGDVGKKPCGSIANVLDEEHSSLNDKLRSDQVYLAQVTRSVEMFTEYLCSLYDAPVGKKSFIHSSTSPHATSSETSIF